MSPPKGGFMVPPVTVAMRAYYSRYHLHAAGHFAGLAVNIEAEYTGESVFNITHRAYVTSAVLCAVGFLESSINELYQDAADKYESYIQPLSPKAKTDLAKLWSKAKGRDMRILDKFQKALALAGERGFPKGRQPYQDAALVIRLRNELVHYRPKTLSAASVPKLQAQLMQKFPPNRLMASVANPWFPDKCLGAGCALWATKAAKDFADAFFSKLGITPNYQLM
jgi:hypothetical protein